MSIRGVWQLKKLMVKYCDQNAGSRGVRDFIQTYLPQFKKCNPQMEIETAVNRGHDPYLQAFYLNAREKVVGCRNADAKRVLTIATRMRNSTGRKVVKLKQKHWTKTPSIQGTWTPFLKIE